MTKNTFTEYMFDSDDIAEIIYEWMQIKGYNPDGVVFDCSIDRMCGDKRIYATARCSKYDEEVNK